MYSTGEIEELLRSGVESRRFELKGPGDCDDKPFFATVARAALAMGNLRDGGHVVIGIDDTRRTERMPGLQPAALDSWLATDAVARRMAVYADPPLRFAVEARSLSSGVDVAVIEVFEFADIPHLCRKDYPGVLRDGALYVRTRKLPETSEVPSSLEMRDVLDLATVKSLRAYVETAQRAGLTLTVGKEIQAGQGSDDAQFDAEREEGWR